MKKINAIILTISLFSCASVRKSNDDQFKIFLQNYFDKTLEKSPQTQTMLGKPTNKDKWDENTFASFQENIHEAAEFAKALEGFSPDKHPKPVNLEVSYEILKDTLKQQLDGEKFYYHHFFLSHFNGDHLDIVPFLMSYHLIETIDDAQNYIKRIKGLERKLDQANTRIIEMAQRGILLPKWSYDKIILTFENLANNPEQSDMIKDFNGKIDLLEKKHTIEKNEGEKLKQMALAAFQESFVPSVKKINITLKELMNKANLDDGIWRLPEGVEYYQYLLNNYTSTQLSYDQIHQIGLDNVARIHREMEEIKKKVKFKGTLQQFFKFMRTDKKNFYDNNDKGRELFLKDSRDMAQRIEKVLPNYFGILPKSALVVKAVEKFREKSSGSAFYNQGSPDGKVPGTYYANLYDMSAMAKSDNEALIYHEGVPGHHFQISIAQELTDIPEFQKYGLYNAYVEGWGLYAEWFAKEIGFYQDPYSDFGRLSMELMRAMRLVVDTGIHAYKWTREQAIEYFLKNSSIPKSKAREQIERYIVFPAQACSYLIGKLKIQEFYLKSKEKLKDKFDPKKFHDAVLDSGAMPLSVLEYKLKKLDLI